MDFKSIVAGAILGAGVCGAIWWLTERTPKAVAPPAETAAPTPPAVQSQAIDAQHDPDALAQSPPPIAAGPGSDTSADVLDTEISTSNAARAKRWNEERDLAWAYGAEQAIRQYLATHKAASSFEIVQVECRTSFCEVEAIGYADEAWSWWIQIGQDVVSQPWSEFESSASSGGSREGRPMFIATFFRRQLKAE